MVSRPLFSRHLLLLLLPPYGRIEPRSLPIYRLLQPLLRLHLPRPSQIPRPPHPVSHRDRHLGAALHAEQVRRHAALPLRAHALRHEPVPYPTFKESGEVHPLRRLALEELADELLDVLAGRDADGFLRLFSWTSGLVRELDAVFAFFNPPEKLDVVVGAEGGFADSHFVEDSANGPEVGFGVVALVSEDLRSHVQSEW
jgi:hypothetical protein